MRKNVSKTVLTLGLALASMTAFSTTSRAESPSDAVIRVRGVITGMSQVTVDASIKEAEIVLAGSKMGSGPLGSVIQVDREGAIELRSEAQLSADDTSNFSAKGRARLETAEATDEDLNDQLVISGSSAKLLYQFLRAGRKLSIRIDDDGASIVGQDVTCENEEFEQYVCTVTGPDTAEDAQ